MSAILNPNRAAPNPASLGAPTTGLIARLAEIVGAVVERLLTWQERATQRYYLAGLDDRMLRDIGLTRADALREYGKLPWQD